MSISINSSSEEIERSGKLAELEPLERTSCATKVKEKTREKANFCDYFKLTSSYNDVEKERQDALAKASALFKK